MRRYRVRVEFWGNRLFAKGVGSVDADEFDRFLRDESADVIGVQIHRVTDRTGACDEWRNAYGFCFEEGEEVPMFPVEIEVIEEYWEPGPGEQRLLGEAR